MHRPEEISVTGLRQFGAGLGVLIVIVFVVLVPWIRDLPAPLWPWLPGFLLVALAAWRPRWLRPVYRGWFPIALALAWFNTRLLLGIVFFLLMMPLGWLLRALGKLQYDESRDPAATTYRVEVAGERSREDMERPY